MYSAFFTPYLRPDKSKTALHQLIKRRFPYPEPVLKRQNTAKINRSDLIYNILYINEYSLFLIECI